MRTFFALLLLTAAFIATADKPRPTKKQMVSQLKAVCQLILDEDYAAAADQFILPAGMSPERSREALAGLVTKREISLSGIDILKTEGTFGPLKEIFPERGPRWMERSAIATAGDCYGLAYKNAEVAGFWTGKQFKFFRMDDVGKLY
ncbi:MAG: hypothetical protein AAGN35_01295 [Bacteroidota bacterium]